MQVRLGRPDRGVPEQFLDDVDGRAPGQQLGGRRAPEQCAVTTRSSSARRDNAASHLRTVSVDIGRPIGLRRNVTSTKSSRRPPGRPPARTGSGHSRTAPPPLPAPPDPRTSPVPGSGCPADAVRCDPGTAQPWAAAVATRCRSDRRSPTASPTRRPQNHRRRRTRPTRSREVIVGVPPMRPGRLDRYLQPAAEITSLDPSRLVQPTPIAHKNRNQRNRSIP